MHVAIAIISKSSRWFGLYTSKRVRMLQLVESLVVSPVVEVARVFWLTVV